MSYKKIFWGVMLIILGLLFVLKNTGIIFFSWWTFFNLWPVWLILWGVSIFPIKSSLKVIISILIVIGAIFLAGKFDSKSNWLGFGFEKEFLDNDSYNPNYEQKMAIDIDTALNKAELKIDAGACKFKINELNDSTKYLTVNKQGNSNAYSLTSENDDNKYTIHLKMKENAKTRRNADIFNLALNKNVEWDFDMDIGAAAIDFDLTPFIVNNIDIDGGASNIKMKIGDKSILTKLDIDAGAASINIDVPISSGVEIHTETALSSKEFKDFNKINRNLYQTGNYSTATNKIIINIDAAVSSINILRY